jgi:hypothetical protein
MSHTSVKNTVCVLAGYVVRVVQNRALKWNKKLTGVRSHAVTSDHTLMHGLMPQVQYQKFWKSMDGKCFPTRRTVLTLSLPAFDLFPELNKPLRGKSFRSIEEVSNEVTRVIRRINNEGVLTRMHDLPKRWTAVIKHNGDYIGGL